MADIFTIYCNFIVRSKFIYLAFFTINLSPDYFSRILNMPAVVSKRGLMMRTKMIGTLPSLKKRVIISIAYFARLQCSKDRILIDK